VIWQGCATSPDEVRTEAVATTQKPSHRVRLRVSFGPWVRKATGKQAWVMIMIGDISSKNAGQPLIGGVDTSVSPALHQVASRQRQLDVVRRLRYEDGL
jgi:hypothetical protein